MSLFPALGRLRQENDSVQASVGYVVDSRLVKDI